jgi:hypothetical protein
MGAAGPQALAMIDIGNPRIDWLAMAQSMGVPATPSKPPGFYARAGRCGAATRTKAHRSPSVTTPREIEP